MSMEIDALLRGAIIKDDPEQVEQLLANGVRSLDKQTGFNALMMAAEFYRPKSLAVLMKRFDIRCKTRSGSDAMTYLYANRFFFAKEEDRQACETLLKARLAEIESEELMKALNEAAPVEAIQPKTKRRL